MLVFLAVFVVALGAAVANNFNASAATCSTTADCQAQINSLNAQTSQSQQSLNTLAAQAGSYQATLNALQTQISGLQAQITANQNQQVALQAQIDADQTQIAYQKQVLSADLRAMYVEGQTTTLEVLASSNDLSQFVTKEVDRSAVQDKVNATLNNITQLENQLKTQQSQIATLLQTQQTQSSQLSSAASQQAQLLGYNQSQQSTFNQQIATNKVQINQLQAQIVALNTPVGSSFTYSGSCGGGYPATAGPGLWGGTWGCNYGQDNTTDNWGMYNRECVSYTAWMVHEEYVDGLVAHDMPNWGGVGNAYQWIDDAQNAGIPVDQTPEIGDIAIRPASGINGDVGHAMYVKAVSGDQIYVQQYNADLRGDYSEGWRSDAGLYFLHFQQWQ